MTVLSILFPPHSLHVDAGTIHYLFTPFFLVVPVVYIVLS